MRQPDPLGVRSRLPLTGPRSTKERTLARTRPPLRAARTTTRPSRRTLLAGAGAAALALTGCTPTALHRDPRGRTDLSFWHLLGGGDSRLMNQIIAKVNDLNPTARVNQTVLAWGDPYYTKAQPHRNRQGQTRSGGSRASGRHVPAAETRPSRAAGADRACRHSILGRRVDLGYIPQSSARPRRPSSTTTDTPRGKSLTSWGTRAPARRWTTTSAARSGTPRPPKPSGTRYGTSMRTAAKRRKVLRTSDESRGQNGQQWSKC
jgi:hypothetical protein